MDANATRDVLAYWAPVVGICSLLVFTMGIPALLWLYDLKSNHVHTIEENSKKSLDEQRKTNDSLIRIEALLSAKK